MLDGIDGVRCLMPAGAFYAFPSMEGLIGRTIAGRIMGSTLDIASVVLDEAKVAFVPGEAFGAPGYARFSFALGLTDIETGIARIADLVAS